MASFLLVIVSLSSPVLSVLGFLAITGIFAMIGSFGKKLAS